MLTKIQSTILAIAAFATMAYMDSGMFYTLVFSAILYYSIVDD